MLCCANLSGAKLTTFAQTNKPFSKYHSSKVSISSAIKKKSCYFNVIF